MRSKLITLLVSPHFQRIKTTELLLLLMKWAWGWWIFIFFILSTYIKSCILYFLVYFYFTFLAKEIFSFSIYWINLSWLWTKLRCGNRHFDVHLWRIRTVHFLSKDRYGASYEGNVGWKCCFFSRQSRLFLTLMLYFKKYFSLFVLCFRV